MIIDAQVKLNGTDISDHVISYQRSQFICTGVGTLSVELERDFNHSVTTYDVLSLYEDGNKKGEYYVGTISRNAGKHSISLEAQDASKRLQDYFISEQYNIDYLSYARTWIEQFLNEAGVSYHFNTASSGTPLSNNTSLGFTSAMDAITGLMQQCGWYLYADKDNVIQIGSLDSFAGGIKAVFRETDILEIKTNKNDRKLRNRAVVWGSGDPVTQSWVFADQSIHTKWNYDRQDKRAVVISNSNIKSHADAQLLAAKALDAFANITYEKEISLEGEWNIHIGDFVQVRSEIFRGKGRVTQLGSSMSKGGLTTEVILDQQCPRLFTFFDYGGEVYIGTEADGVWKKHMNYDHTWNNFSTGLSDLKVTDLEVSHGVLACVASGILNTRDEYDSTWVSFDPDTLVTISGISYDKEDFECVACTINTFENTIFGGYTSTTSGVENRSWVVELSSEHDGKTAINTYPVVIAGEENYRLIDAEHNSSDLYITCAGQGGTSLPDSFRHSTYMLPLPLRTPETALVGSSDLENSIYSITTLSGNYNTITSPDIYAGGGLTFGDYGFIATSGWSRRLLFDTSDPIDFISASLATGISSHASAISENKVLHVVFSTSTIYVYLFDFIAGTQSTVTTISCTSPTVYYNHMNKDGNVCIIYADTGGIYPKYLHYNASTGTVAQAQIGTERWTCTDSDWIGTYMAYTDVNSPIASVCTDTAAIGAFMFYTGNALAGYDAVIRRFAINMSNGSLSTNTTAYDMDTYTIRNFQGLYTMIAGSPALMGNEMYIEYVIQWRDPWGYPNYSYATVVTVGEKINSGAGYTTSHEEDYSGLTADVYSHETTTRTLQEYGSNDWYYWDVAIRQSSSNMNGCYIQKYDNKIYWNLSAIKETGWELYETYLSGKADDFTNNTLIWGADDKVYVLSSTGATTYLMDHPGGGDLTIVGKYISSYPYLVVPETEFEIGTGLNTLAKYDRYLQEFISLKETLYDIRVETSKTYPVIGYGGTEPSAGFLTLSEYGLEETFMDTSLGVNNGFISDARNVKIYDTEFDAKELIYLAVPSNPGILYLDYLTVVSGIGGYNGVFNTYVVSSGLENITHIETTNYIPVPYTFASYWDGFTSRFFQRDGDDDGFIIVGSGGDFSNAFDEYSSAYSLPTSKINVIRVDEET